MVAVIEAPYRMQVGTALYFLASPCGDRFLSCLWMVPNHCTWQVAKYPVRAWSAGIDEWQRTGAVAWQTTRVSERERPAPLWPDRTE